jgi:hypothetical protein
MMAPFVRCSRPAPVQGPGATRPELQRRDHPRCKGGGFRGALLSPIRQPQRLELGDGRMVAWNNWAGLSP